MSPSLRKAGILILAIIVLPVLIFTVVEIGSLRKNEIVIQNIYRNQLDAILFSINQYSDDIVSNLAGRIENSQNSFRPDSGKAISKIIREMPSVISLIQFDKKGSYVFSSPDSLNDSSLLSELKADLEENTKAVKQLQTYMRGGYRKIETLGIISGHLQSLTFLTSFRDNERINILLIDPEKFITQVLDPRIQEIAKGKFDIAAFRPGEDVPFYTSNKNSQPRSITNREHFWLLKNYYMGIELKDLTIADLAKNRMKRNIILLGIMDLILLFGALLIFRNIAKQVELSQLKSDFVSSVSHEIRTPLALITMYIETLEMGRVTEKNKVAEYYEIILNETSRLSGIVNRILSFSQIESNKRKYTFTAVSINEMVENAAFSLKHTLDSKGFSYNYYPATDLPDINADRDAITDAFINLVDNAIKYSPDNKNITVKTGRTDKTVFLQVQDEGIGISLKNQKYIFDKFYRVTETNIANKVKGSGLGLAIVRHIMDAHQGTIEVESKPGEGSLFRLSFPIINGKKS